MTDQHVGASQSTEPLVGDVYGMRYFWVGLRHLKPVSPLSPFRFKPGMNEAHCRRDHRPGDVDCTCGIHAYYDDSPERIDSPYDERWTAKGIIAASGQITSADFGFRAERAQIVALVEDGSEDRKTRRDCWIGCLSLVAYSTGLLWAGIESEGDPLLFFKEPNTHYLLGFIAPLLWLLSVPMLHLRKKVMASYGVPIFASTEEATTRFPLSHHPDGAGQMSGELVEVLNEASHATATALPDKDREPCSAEEVQPMIQEAQRPLNEIESTRPEGDQLAVTSREETGETDG